MDKELAIELASSFGFEVDFVDDSQCRVRFVNEFTFVDVWFGKKGITAGVYNTILKTMKYQRHCKHEDLEDIFDNADK